MRTGLIVFAMVFVGNLYGQDAAAKLEQPLSLHNLKAEGRKSSKYAGIPNAAKSNAIGDVTTPQADLDTFRRTISPILKRACVDCHGEETAEGNIRLDSLDPDLIGGDDSQWWLEILAVLSNGEMPPSEDSELPDNDRAAVVEWLSHELQVASQVRRAGGDHSSFRRMTRYEYNYALQDLLGLPYNFAKDLPPEPRSEDGFQNSSEMLHMSVVQLETYRSIARKSLRRAIPLGEKPLPLHWGATMKEASRFEWPKQDKQIEQRKNELKDDPEKQKLEIDRLIENMSQPHGQTYYQNQKTGRTAKANWAYGGAKYAFAPSDAPIKMPDSFDHIAIIPPGRNQNLIIELGNRVPDEGIMRVRVRASHVTSDDLDIPSMQLDFGWRASNEGRAIIRVSLKDKLIDAPPGKPKIYQWDIPLGEIYPRNSVRKTSAMGTMPNPSEYIRLVNSSASKGSIQIDYVEVAAPVYDQWPTKTHREIFIASPHQNDEMRYAHDVLSNFMMRAWRRPITKSEIDSKVGLFQSLRPQCESFEDAMLEALATVLSSPEFLYVTAKTPIHKDDPIKTTRVISDDDLAERLALFLWCSLPDGELMKLAKDGQLHQPDALSNQVQRMLADGRSERFAKHFVHQWLNMQLLEHLDIQQHVRGFDPLLKEAMQEEPVALFQEILKNNSSSLDFIHADYTMANERLATHYGIPNVRGNHFRRVALTENHRRGGLLTQAGLLMMNSDGTDSHPLKRGVWLLENILNDPPPPPPPAVPEVDLADPEIAKMTLKQRLEDHRNHAACKSCHARIDPWGFTFENYDAVGRWRDKIKDRQVDSIGVLFNQQELRGMDGLKRYLLEHRQDQFVHAMVSKLTTYALGRPLTFSDHADVEQITAKVRDQGDGLATIIELIVQSELFRSK